MNDFIIVRRIRLGLEVFQVYHGNTYESEFVSAAGARTRVHFLQRRYTSAQRVAA